ncbi:MAG TPA: O-antigen ligase family protein [Candidatus Magasanikbacteria bacterium]|nr:O-antigen ligase family protein [Candidatus Magasanikbacteria bacterium]
MLTTISIFSVFFFAVLCVLRIDLAYTIFAFLLPTYLIRYDFFGIPTTYLELIFIPLTIFSLFSLHTEITQTIKNHLKNKRAITVGILLFFIGAFIGIFFSPETRSALGSFKAFFVEPIIFYFLILAAWVKYPKLKNQTIYALLSATVITSLLAIFQHFTGWMVPWDFWQNRNTYRVTGFWGYPNGVGLFVAPLSLLVFSILKINTGSKKIFQSFNLLIFFTLTTLACLYAKSTGALIAILAGILLFCLSIKKIRLLIIFGIVLITLSVTLLPQTKPIRDEIFLHDYSGSLRVNIWGETTALLSDHPIVGSGLAGYKTLIRPYRIDKWIEVFEHPHNLWLSVWVNAGLVGFTGLILITLSIIDSAWNAIRRNDWISSSAHVPMIAIFVFGLVDTPYLKNDSVFIFFFALALITSIGYNIRRDKLSTYE